MTLEELNKVPFSFVSHMSGEHKHTSTYINKEYGFAMCTHTKCIEGIAYGRTITHYLYILIVCIMAYAGHKGMSDWVGIGIVVGFLILFFSIALVFACFPERMSPTAIDAYRGHTTLQITYKDSVAVDSTVVFKDEYIKSIKP